MPAFNIKLASGTAKVGPGGFWTDAAAVKAAGVTEVDVEIWIDVDMDTIEKTNGDVIYICRSGSAIFDPLEWRTGEFGLIYTDNVFSAEINRILKEAGYDTEFAYSEQGRQSAHYVDFDIDIDFAYEQGRHAAMGQHDRFLAVDRRY